VAGTRARRLTRWLTAPAVAVEPRSLALDAELRNLCRPHHRYPVPVIPGPAVHTEQDQIVNPMAVNISGNYTEKTRPNNGMEKVGPYLHDHRLVRIPVVAYVEWFGHAETLTGEKLSVVLPAIEPGITASGGDIPGLPVQDGFPTTAAGQIMWLLDSIRRAGGKGAVADTLFSVPSDVHRASDDDEDEEMEGQLPLPVETRLGADGPHEVPPASGEELMAERAEARAAAGGEPATAATEAIAAAAKDAERNATSGVPAATFAAPGGTE
jgi:hypothetical protein